MDAVIENNLNVEVSHDVYVEVSDQARIAIEEDQDLSITAIKREFTVVNDAVFPKVYEEAPEWMQVLIDNTSQAANALARSDLLGAQTALEGMLDELEVAKNSYDVSIAQLDSVDSRISTAVTTLNSDLMGTSGTVVQLLNTKVTSSEATALAATSIDASIDSGRIAASNTELITSIADLDSSMSGRISTLEATYEGQGQDIAALSSSYDLVNTKVTDQNTEVSSKFGYTSSLTLDGNNYITGFDVTASMEDKGGNITTRSDFVISADEFKIVNPIQTGTVTDNAPPTFSVDASTGVSRFNGVVEFSNIGGITGSVLDGLDNVTTIDAGKITTNTIWVGGVIQDDLFKANPNYTTGFQIKANASGTTSDPNIYGAYIKGGTLEGSTIMGQVFDVGTDLVVKAGNFVTRAIWSGNVYTGVGIGWPGTAGNFLNAFAFDVRSRDAASVPSEAMRLYDNSTSSVIYIKNDLSTPNFLFERYVSGFSNKSISVRIRAYLLNNPTIDEGFSSSASVSTIYDNTITYTNAPSAHSINVAGLLFRVEPVGAFTGSQNRVAFTLEPFSTLNIGSTSANGYLVVSMEYTNPSGDGVIFTVQNGGTVIVSSL